MSNDIASGIPFQENSLSSQESSTKRGECMQSNDNKSPDRIVHEPLSGKPYFTCVISKSNVQNQFHLVVPKVFYPLLPEAASPVVLARGDKTWEMHYLGDRALRKFDNGWRRFVRDNHLKVGDACVFELMDSESLRFKVHVLDGQIPSDALSKGGSLDAPILID